MADGNAEVHSRLIVEKLSDPENDESLGYVCRGWRRDATYLTNFGRTHEGLVSISKHDGKILHVSAHAFDNFKPVYLLDGGSGDRPAYENQVTIRNINPFFEQPLPQSQKKWAMYNAAMGMISVEAAMIAEGVEWLHIWPTHEAYVWLFSEMGWTPLPDQKIHRKIPLEKRISREAMRLPPKLGRT
jgi:hypothetical protein